MADTISRAELEQAIAEGGVTVLEALGPMYFEDQHLPGARNLPLEQLDELAPVLVPDKGTPVVTYCSNTACNNSTIAAERLTALGYANVRKYPGGKQDWIEAGLPVESGAAVASR